MSDLLNNLVSVFKLLFPFLFSSSAVLFPFLSLLPPKLHLSNCLPTSHLTCLFLSLSLSFTASISFFFFFLLRLTGRHNSRCLVMVLKTCLLHDGRLASPHLASTPSALQFSSALTPPSLSPLGSGGILHAGSKTRAIMLLLQGVG